MGRLWALVGVLELALRSLHAPCHRPFCTMPAAAGSLSPRRKRVRRYFSASAATGRRLTGKFSALSATGSNNAAATSRTRRRSSSASSTGFDFSPDHASDSGIEDEASLPISDDGSHFSRSDPPLASASQPKIYASLPPSPISPSPLQASTPPYASGIPTFPSAEIYHEPPFSIWDYLREELLATDFDSHQELKWERVSNFLHMPVALEKVSSYAIFLSVIGRIPSPCGASLTLVPIHPYCSQSAVDILLWIHSVP